MSRPIAFTTVSTPDEVRQILDLQAANLPAVLTPDTMESQGFVTVRHDPDVLQRMNQAAPSIIAKDGERVVGYALVMPRAFASDVPILRPLFAMLDGLSWRGALLREHPRWFVMGQICVAEAYRGRGIVDGLYRTMAEVSRDRYDFTVTEVAARNTRSLRVHARAGFRTLQVYADATTGEDWHVIVLDFAGSDGRAGFKETTRSSARPQFGEAGDRRSEPARGARRDRPDTAGPGRGPGADRDPRPGAWPRGRMGAVSQTSAARLAPACRTRSVDGRQTASRL